MSDLDATRDEPITGVDLRERLLRHLVGAVWAASDIFHPDSILSSPQPPRGDPVSNSR